MGLIKSKDKEVQEQYHRHYINTMSEMVQCAITQVTIEEQPQIIYANDKLYDIIGYSREEFETLYNNILFKVIHEYDYDRVVKFISDMMLFDTKKQFDVRIKRKDGQIRWISCGMKRTVNADAVPVLLISVVDITEKILYQKRIDELSDNVPCGLARLCIRQDKIDILSANYMFYNMFYDEEDIKQKLFDCPEFVDRVYYPIISDGIEYPMKETFELHFDSVSKKDCYIKVSGKFVGIELDYPVYLFTFEDVTGDKRYEFRRDKLLSKLSGGVVSVIFDEKASFEKSSASFDKTFGISDEILSEGLFSLFLEEERQQIKHYVYNKAIRNESIEFSGHMNFADNRLHMVKVYGIFRSIKKGNPYYSCYFFKFEDNDFFKNENEDEDVNVVENPKIDNLTQFYNKQYIGDIINDELAKLPSGEEGLFATFMLQNFAEINERYGYLFGDKLLREIAMLLRQMFGEEAIIGRTGGMEFCLFLNDVAKEDFAIICDKFCNNITNIYVGDDDEITLKCKVGITYVEDEDFYQNMYERTHIALYRLLHDNCNQYDKDYLYDEDINDDIENININKNYFALTDNVGKEEKELDDVEEFKHEFMSRMSHEIRTPMNAISGMSDMLLANGLTGMNLEYASMIKTASNNLISIVDDILDIAKLESGQIEITPEEYKIKSLIEDMTFLTYGKLKKTDISFVVYINPDMPKVLYGDKKRIRQIVMNMLSNAVKFTSKGFIRLSVDFKQCGDDEIELSIAVKDSGIGIHKKDMGRLFEQFTQADSRRTRNVDGVGLGLAVSKQIASRMNGNIMVESEAGIGSKFTFVVRQSVKDERKIVNIADVDKYSLLVYEKDKYCRMELMGLFNELNIKSKFVENKREFIKLARDDQFTHVFFDYGKAFYDLKYTIEKNPSKKYVAMIGRDTTHPQILECENYSCVYKPFKIYELDKVLTGTSGIETENLQKFISKDLKVLIVDDNPVNLKVAQGLISSYQCKISTALSGFEALELLAEDPSYDILFIDHMMPSMDGVETLHRIRKTLGEYGENVKAVALTANVLPEAREMFAENGFHGFLGKPIIAKYLHEVMDSLVSEDKKKLLESVDDVNSVKTISEEDIERVAMKGVDVESGLRCCGNDVDDYLNIISVVLASGKIKVKELKKYAEEKNYEMYGIEAHALKSVAASIGAIKQSDLAREHEYAVKEKRYNVIDNEYQKLINGYQRLLIQIKTVLDKEENKQHNNEEKEIVDEHIWNSKIVEAISAISKYEQRYARALLKELQGYHLPDTVNQAVNKASEKMKIYEDEEAQRILENVIKKDK